MCIFNHMISRETLLVQPYIFSGRDKIGALESEGENLHVSILSSLCTVGLWLQLPVTLRCHS